MSIINKLFGRRQKYDFETIEGIRSINIPNYKSNNGVETPVNNIEYILQRKATEYRKKGRMDLAIECLRKSNEIMKYSNFLWSLKDYTRLVEFLKQNGQWDAARVEENKILNYFNSESKNINLSVFEITLENCKGLNTDLVITSEVAICCRECAKYAKRIFSISGKDKRFPLFPNYFKLDLPEHAFCVNFFYPFMLDLSNPVWSYKGNLFTWSNRPFIDERTNEQKEYFKNRVENNNQEVIDRKKYDYLREFFPEIAPKSFGGYRRMKNLRSANYLKLLDEANQKGIDLNEKPELSIYYF